MLELSTERSKQGLLERVDGQLEFDDEREQVVHEPEAGLELGQLESDALEELQLRHELVHFGRALCHERARVQTPNRVLQQRLQLLVFTRCKLKSHREQRREREQKTPNACTRTSK